MGLAEQVQPEPRREHGICSVSIAWRTPRAPAARMPLPATITDARCPQQSQQFLDLRRQPLGNGLGGWSEAGQLGRIDLSSLNVEGNVDPHGTTATAWAV